MPEEEKAEPTYRKFWAKSTNPNVCGVWDPHPQQQDGEVFLSGDKVLEVAATPIVLDALAKGRIVEVSGPKIEPPQAAEGAPAQAAIGGKAPADAAEEKKK